jgi:hypothetical protein
MLWQTQSENSPVITEKVIHVGRYLLQESALMTGKVSVQHLMQTITLLERIIQ